MNWNGEFTKQHHSCWLITGIIVILTFLALAIFNYTGLKVCFTKANKAILAITSKTTKETPKNNKTPLQLKELKYEEYSPDQSKKVILYQTKYDPAFYNDYDKDFFLNNTIIAVVDLENSQERDIFIDEERTGNPHWLGNEYVFFTTYCGTACKGIYLSNVDNKELRLGVWGYTFSESKNEWIMHFKDWFNFEHEFEGGVDEVISETLGDKTYLIFRRKNYQGNALPEKRFLFTGDKLIESDT